MKTQRAIKNSAFPAVGLVIVALLACAATAFASGLDIDGKFSLFGNAQWVTGGLRPGEMAVDLTSNCGAQPYSNTCYSDTSLFVYSGVNFTPTPHHITPMLSDIAVLSAAYNVGGADCGGGGPRFSIALSGGKNIFVYFGPFPNFTNCYYGWQNTGNVILATDARWDTSQLASGTFYDTHAHALTLAGSIPVTSISIVLDGGWMTPRGQDVTIDAFRVNNSVIHTQDRQDHDDDHHDQGRYR
jgi:hypothetical protein